MPPGVWTDEVRSAQRYIRDFMRLTKETATPRELYDRMLDLYRDHIDLGSQQNARHRAIGGVEDDDRRAQALMLRLVTLIARRRGRPCLHRL